MKKLILLKLLAVINVACFPAFVLASKAPEEAQKKGILSKAYRMSIPFIENQGQVENKDVKFYAKTLDGTLFVEKDGVLSYSLPSNDKEGVVIREILTDKRLKAKGLESSPTKVNYFIGLSV
jgi:hypothetical protein